PKISRPLLSLAEMADTTATHLTAPALAAPLACGCNDKLYFPFHSDARLCATRRNAAIGAEQHEHRTEDSHRRRRRGPSRVAERPAGVARRIRGLDGAYRLQGYRRRQERAFRSRHARRRPAGHGRAGSLQALA